MAAPLGPGDPIDGGNRAMSQIIPDGRCWVKRPSLRAAVP